MRKTFGNIVEAGRIQSGPLASNPGEHSGAFVITHGVAWGLRAICSNGDGWDHVSVSLPNRCPTWEEMSVVARLFFEDDERLVMYRPPASEYVNCHPYCLHWWRPQNEAMPFPPSYMVGPKE